MKRSTNTLFALSALLFFAGCSSLQLTEEAVANQYMVRGLTDTAGEHGKFADEFFAGNASWAGMYQKLISLGTIIDDSYDECEILYSAE